MTHLSLFSGIGGIDIAAHWAGFQTIAFVEREPFCQLVLTKNFPGVPIHDDVTTFDAESFRGRVTLLSGGFPCQDISTAGKGAGLTGERSGLWFAMLDVISRVRPRFVLAENVAALYSRGIDTVLRGLEEAGYTAEPFVVGACDVGAPHRRKRVFIVAELSNPNGIGCVDREHDILANQTGQYAQYDIGESRHSELGDADQFRRPRHSALPGSAGQAPEERWEILSQDGREYGRGSQKLDNANSGTDSALGHGETDGVPGEYRAPLCAGNAGETVTELGDSCISGCGRFARRRSGTVTQDGHLQPETSQRIPNANGMRQSQPEGRKCDQRRRIGNGSQSHRVSNAQSEQSGRIQQSELFADIGADGESQNVPNADYAGRGEQRWTVSGATPHTTAFSGGAGSLESVVGGKFDGLSSGLDGCFRFPARPGEEQHEWEAPRTITSKLPDRAKRLKALGNAVVPAQVYPIFVAIANRVQGRYQYGIRALGA